MIDGLLQEQLSEMMGIYDTSANKQVIQSAVALAKKYRVDVAHAKRVSQLSLRLFDQLQPIHRLEGRYRLLLEVAGLLHEIGTFVSSRKHHKHTLYLIQQSEVFGLTQEELLMVANIARYHRRGRPKASHPEYIALTRNKRMTVNKLTALLRVADALDIGRTQQINPCEFSIQAETLVVHVSTQADLALEKKALKNKSDMFQDIYGLDIRLEQTPR
jgi:exopolyphosphatase/guanosine-5'-triphosphate,3'-diphosphate pyrophosphatase